MAARCKGGSGTSCRCSRQRIRSVLRSWLATMNFCSRASLISAGDGGPQPKKIGLVSLTKSCGDQLQHDKPNHNKKYIYIMIFKK
jgi:hypothetical protein